MVKCKTCSEPIPDKSMYCPRCGAKQITKRLTVKTLLKSLLSKLADLDFSFYRTTKSLLIKPEEVTNGYINGVRKIINSPIQYALIVISIYGVFQFLFSDFLNFTAQNNPLSDFGEGWNNFEGSNEVSQSKKMNNAINWFQSRSQFLIFSTIPLIGFFSSIFYDKRGYNYAEHTVIAIYAVSLTLILSVIVGLILAPFGSETAAIYYVNISYVLTTIVVTWIFKQSFSGSIFKPLLILLLSFICMSFLLGFGLMMIVAFT